ATLGGEVVLRRDPAQRALARVGGELDLDALETALGILRVADAEMIRALRVISVHRGLDPRDFALVAFGGAGGMHACALAEELGIETVLIPRAAGVLSALGLAISDLRRDDVAPRHVLLGDVGADELEAAFAELEASAGTGLVASPFLRRADLRYRMMFLELTVDSAVL